MSASDVPVVPAWFQNGFHRFLRPYLRRHFHSVAVEQASIDRLLPDDDRPLIIYANHPSWWDPLVAHFLNRLLFPGRQFYAPIDADALEQYSVFGKLGFYGVKVDSVRGAAAFLKQSLAIARAGQTCLWITPEGRFADIRDHSAELMPGLPHLCTRLFEGRVVPLALEYVFWDDRLPNCLFRFGPPLEIAEFGDLSKRQWSALLSEELRDSQRALADLVVTRDATPFRNLLKGHRGAGGVYDTMRRLKAWARGRSFRPSHGDQFS